MSTIILAQVYLCLKITINLNLLKIKVYEADGFTQIRKKNQITITIFNLLLSEFWMSSVPYLKKYSSITFNEWQHEWISVKTKLDQQQKTRLCRPHVQQQHRGRHKLRQRSTNTADRNRWIRPLTPKILRPTGGKY